MAEKEKNLEKLISEYDWLDTSITESANILGFKDGLRHIDGEFSKSKEQRVQEKVLEEKIIARQKIKNEIACRLGFPKIAFMEEFDFYKFLLMNFQVEGNQVKQRAILLMPSQITPEMLKEAAREADRRAGRYVAPEKPKRKK